MEGKEGGRGYLVGIEAQYLNFVHKLGGLTTLGLKKLYARGFFLRVWRGFSVWNSVLPYKPCERARNLSLEEHSFNPLVFIHLLREFDFFSLFRFFVLSKYTSKDL